MPEVFSTIAEVSIGLAGFSGIVVIIDQRSRTLTDLDRFRLIILLTPALAAAVLALLSLALTSSGLEHAGRLTAGILVVFCVGFPLSLVRPTLRCRAEHPEIFHDWNLILLIVGYAAVAILSALLALGVWGTVLVTELGLIWLVFHSATQFVRMLFVRPGQQPPAAYEGELG